MSISNRIQSYQTFLRYERLPLHALARTCGIGGACLIAKRKDLRRMIPELELQREREERLGVRSNLLVI